MSKTSKGGPSLKLKWLEYRESCYPKSAGPISALQESETSQAFYSGALIVLELIVNSSEQETPEDAADYFTAICLEAERELAARVVRLNQQRN